MDDTNGQVGKQDTLPQSGWWSQYTQDDLRLSRLHPSAALVYLAIKSYADADGQCWPSYQAIMELIRVKRNTVATCIKLLVQHGYLTVSHRWCATGRKASLYTIKTQSIPLDTLATTQSIPNGQAKVSQTGIPKVSPGILELDPIEQEPLNQTHKNTPLPPSHLLELIDGWNALGSSVGPAVRRDPPSKELMDVYKRLSKDPEMRDAFQDVPTLMAKVRQATYCHGQGWFTLPFLFTRDTGTRELRVRKILREGYNSNGNHKHQHNQPGPGQVYDSSTEPAAAGGTKSTI